MSKTKLREHSNLKRIVSAILCCVMCLAMFSTAISVQGETIVNASTETELMNAITSAGSVPTTINVTDDILFVSAFFLSTAIDIPSGADITIRPSQKSISFTKFADDVSIFNVENGGKLTLSSNGDYKLTVDGNSVSSSASSITVLGDLVTNDVDFINHTLLTGDGAAISCSGNTASCTINNGTFKDNVSGVNGGAIAVNYAALNIDGATFDNNKVSDPTGSGGAVYCKTSSIDFKNATFTGNSAMAGGAVEFTTECTGEIGGCTFKNNKADGLMGKGGALDFDHCIAVSILSGLFENNYSSTWGGAVYTDGTKSDFFMNTVLFENNSATVDGGAIWHCPLGTSHYYTYSGMMFWNNSAAEAGADMYLSKAAVGLENGGEYVSEKTYAGNSFDWCYDTADSRFDASNPNHITDIGYYQGSNEEIAMKSNIPESEYLAVKDVAGIVFRGNTSSEGGAIANNGFIQVGYKSGLTIEKQVTGDVAPADDTFNFTVTFSDGNTYDSIESGSTVTIKNGEKKLISNIPQGVVATVTEQAKANYTPAKATLEAVIGEYGSELLFVNTYVKPTFGNLTVSKTVTGDGADKTKAFTFTVTLNNNEIDGTYGDMSFEDGVASFKLKDGESKTATSLPSDVTYTVSESDNDGYTVTKTNDTGVIVANETITASFNNYKAATNVVETGTGTETNDKLSGSNINETTTDLTTNVTSTENNANDNDTVSDENDNNDTTANETDSTTLSSDNSSHSPETGDADSVILLIALALITSGAVTVYGAISKRKKVK